jgi:hypothetical protein
MNEFELSGFSRFCLRYLQGRRLNQYAITALNCSLNLPSLSCDMLSFHFAQPHKETQRHAVDGWKRRKEEK